MPRATEYLYTKPIFRFCGVKKGASCVFKVEGKKDLYVAMADRWRPTQMDLRYEDYARILHDMFSEDVRAEVRDRVFIDWKSRWSPEDYG